MTEQTEQTYKTTVTLQKETGKALRIAAYQLEKSMGMILDEMVSRFLSVILTEAKERGRTSVNSSSEPLNFSELEGLDDFSSSEVKENSEEFRTAELL